MTAHNAGEMRGTVQALTRGGATWHARHGLAAAIERDIVPRLLRRQLPGLAVPEACGMTVGQDVLDLAAFALAHDAEATRRYVQDAASRRSFESICFDLLTPAARHLGTLWTEDLCSFTDVTIGMLHLQHALHAIGPTVAPPGFRRRRILLAAGPGEQHTFGLSMVQTFFRRAGWHVTSLAGGSWDELRSAVAARWFGVVGLSFGSEARLLPLAGEIAGLRAASRNQALGVMLGGPIFVASPALAPSLGADGTAADATEAVWLAENLVGTRPAVA